MNLTRVQKRTICDIAQEAYDVWPGREDFERQRVADGVQGFTAWRHQEQFKAVGIQSLTLCKDEHYRRLVAHFCRLRAEARAAAQNLSLF